MASPAITLTTPGRIFLSETYTLGFSFTVASTQSIDALGVYDDGGLPLAVDAQVGLWDASGNLLDSVTVPAAGGTLNGDFRYAGVTPYALTAGTTYVVGAFLSSGSATSLGTGQGIGTGSVNPLVTLEQDQFNDNGAFSFPNVSDGHVGGAWLGANFDLSGGAVPEPSSWAIMIIGTGLAGAVLRRRTRVAI